jgi:hypothetical protein
MSGWCFTEVGFLFLAIGLLFLHTFLVVVVALFKQRKFLLGGVLSAFVQATIVSALLYVVYKIWIEIGDFNSCKEANEIEAFILLWIFIIVPINSIRVFIVYRTYSVRKVRIYSWIGWLGLGIAQAYFWAIIFPSF